MTPVERLVIALVEEHPEDAARALERVPIASAAALIVDLEAAPAAVVLAHLDVGFASSILEAIEPDDAADLIATLEPTVAASVLRRTSTEIVDAVLAACPPGFAATTRAVLAQPARSAGALMDPHAPSLPRDLTVEIALAAVRERPERFRHYIYVVDRSQELVGVTRIVDLIAADPDATLDELMAKPVARLHAKDLEVGVLAHPGWERYRALPVVDDDERLIGVIRDDALNTLRDRNRGAASSAPVALAMSLAELFWLGLAGMTEGMATVVGRGAVRDQATLAAREDAEAAGADVERAP